MNLKKNNTIQELDDSVNSGKKKIQKRETYETRTVDNDDNSSVDDLKSNSEIFLP